MNSLHRHAICGSLFLLISTSFALPAQAVNLDVITQKEASNGIRETLNKTALASTSKLGKADGFLNNAKVHIPLPQGLQQAKQAMRLLGKQKQFDDLEASLNHAAEAAMPEAKGILLGAIRNMSIQDAKSILAGSDDAVTRFFQSKTEAQLTERFRPIVKKITDKSGLAQQYNGVAQQAASLGLLHEDDSHIENYVTKKAMDGLFATLAEEERAIRKDPIGTGSKLLRKIFESPR